MAAELTDSQTTALFATNCVHGQNLASDYDDCVDKAKKGLEEGKTFEEINREIKAELLEKYPRR